MCYQWTSGNDQARLLCHVHSAFSEEVRISKKQLSEAKHALYHGRVLPLADVWYEELQLLSIEPEPGCLDFC